MNSYIIAATIVGTLGCADAPHLASTEQASITFAASMSAKNPVSWWRLGDAGTTAVDSKGLASGTYINSPTRVTGAIIGDSNKAAKFTSSLSQYVLIPDRDEYSLVRARDDFERPVAVGWGTADCGGAWTPQTGSTGFSVSQGVGIISQTAAAGTWQLGLSRVMKDADLQVRVRWSSHAQGAAINPLAIVARRADANNFYRAILRENTNQTLTLIISRQSNGAETVLASTNVGSYTTGDWWYVRFQLEGTALRARAWRQGLEQPTSWAISAIDSFFASGTISIRSSNSGSLARPIVSFDGFRARWLGLTVYSWLRIDNTTFTNGEGDDNNIQWMGKGTRSNDNEWSMRYYSTINKPGTDATLEGCPQPQKRPGRLSAYQFNLNGDLGNGAAYRATGDCENVEGPQLIQGEWYQIVATYQPGDLLDTEAQVRIYINDDVFGNTENGHYLQPGAFYKNGDHPTDAGNGGSPVRIGTATGDSFLTGAIDEVAIFDRVLSWSDVQDLYYAGIGIP